MGQDRIPDRLRETIFEKLFETAEIAKFTIKEAQLYEDSLKYYRDMKNSIDTAREAAQEEKALEIAKELLKNNVSIDIILKSTSLTEEQINKIIPIIHP